MILNQSGKIINDVRSYQQYFDQWCVVYPAPWQAFTHYVSKASYSGNFLDMAATLASRIMGYGEIGVRFPVASQPNDSYHDRIYIYAYAKCQTLCRAVSTLIANAVMVRLGANTDTTPRWQSLCSRLPTATGLEINFWQMGLSR